MFELRIVENGEEKVILKFSKEELMKRIAHLGVLTFFGREVNRIRVPRSFIGLIFNWITAASVSDAVIRLAFPKKAEIIDIQTGEVNDK